MKTILRSFLINGLALWLITQIGSGIIFLRGTETLIITAITLGLFNLFVRPLINLLLLPINILTLGTLRWLVNVITLYLLTLIIPGFQITGFAFTGFSLFGISFPAFVLGAFGGFIAISFLLSFISGLLFWLVK